MNSNTIISEISNALKAHNFNIDLINSTPNINLSKKFPLAQINQTKSSITNIENNSYQNSKIQITLQDKPQTYQSEKLQLDIIEEMKIAIFDTIKALLHNDIVSQIKILSMSVEKAKHSLNKEISIFATLEINSIYNTL